MKAFDRCIPLHVDFSLLFSVRRSDHDFHLSDDAESGPRMGITSTLGAVVVTASEVSEAARESDSEASEGPSEGESDDDEAEDGDSEG